RLVGLPDSREARARTGQADFRRQGLEKNRTTSLLGRSEKISSSRKQTGILLSIWARRTPNAENRTTDAGERARSKTEAAKEDRVEAGEEAGEEVTEAG
ncbi:hypothetical protein GW17_00036978, partial [Ensete ventricosum]